MCKMNKRWEEWIADPDNHALMMREAPELEEYKGGAYCGPSWHPDRPWTAAKLAKYLTVRLIAWLVPDAPFGIHIGEAGFWHDRAYLMGGTRLDRRMDDSDFLDHIWSIASTSGKAAWRRYATYAVGIPYWAVVRLLGWTCFRYHNNTTEETGK